MSSRVGIGPGQDRPLPAARQGRGRVPALAVAGPRFRRRGGVRDGRRRGRLRCVLLARMPTASATAPARTSSTATRPPAAGASTVLLGTSSLAAAVISGRQRRGDAGRSRTRDGASGSKGATHGEQTLVLRAGGAATTGVGGAVRHGWTSARPSGRRTAPGRSPPAAATGPGRSSPPAPCAQRGRVETVDDDDAGAGLDRRHRLGVQRERAAVVERRRRRAPRSASCRRRGWCHRRWTASRRCRRRRAAFGGADDAVAVGVGGRCRAVALGADVDVLHVRVGLAAERRGQTGHVLGDGRLRPVEGDLNVPDALEWLSAWSWAW